MTREGEPCPNCGEPLAARPGRPPRFCAACGQEAHVKPPTLGEFAQQFGGAYFSTEGALWRTLRLLLTKPGELTAQYLAGRRRHYVLPLRLYLTMSVLVLLLMRALGSTGAVNLDINPENPKTGENFRNFTILGLGEVGQGIGVKDGVFFCNSVPDWVCKRVQRRISTDPKVLMAEIENFKDRFLGNIGGAMFLLLPTFAMGLKLVYLNRRMRYTEHLVFALHVHAFWFVALLFTLPGQLWLTVPALVVVPWYTMLAMRRVYGGRRWLRFLRASLVSFAYLVTLGLAFTFVMLWTLLF